MSFFQSYPQSGRSEIVSQTRFDIHLSTGAGRLEALWIGPQPDEASTLVFLHEGLGCVSLWRDFPERVAASTGCGALVFSRLGYGRSDPCPLPRRVDFMHQEALGVLPDVIRQCGIRDYLLVGHSDGGSIALIHAGGNPGPGLKGVVTMAAHVFSEDLTRRSIEAARRHYLDGDLKKRLCVHHGANTDCAFWGWNDVWLDPDFKNWNIEAFLPPINVPLLAIQGTSDAYGTMAQIESIQRRCGVPVAIQMIADCGHAPHMENSDTVLTGIRDFISSVLSGLRHKATCL